MPLLTSRHPDALRGEGFNCARCPSCDFCECPLAGALRSATLLHKALRLGGMASWADDRNLAWGRA